MFYRAKVLIVVIFVWNSLDHAKAQWNYQNFTAWGDDSPICNTGQNQSPIDLRPRVLGSDNGKPLLDIINYNSPSERTTIANDGHTVRLTGTWSNNNRPSISGAVVLSGEVYNFENAHVHWSTNNNNGTEHSIKGKKYAAELHLVHLNRKYRNVTEASNFSDGIAVIGVLFQVNNFVPPNPGMLQLAQLALTVRNPDSANTIALFNLSSFLPNPIRSFYSYSGSLTTPPCTENVRWIVLSKVEPITSEIIRRLRLVNLNNNDRSNVRPLQQINNRLVEIYKNTEDQVRFKDHHRHHHHDKDSNYD